MEDLQEDNSEEDYFSGGDDVSDSLEKESSVVLSGGMQSDRSATWLPPPKRSRMDKRLVCRIDEALEPENFEEMELHLRTKYVPCKHIILFPLCWQKVVPCLPFLAFETKEIQRGLKEPPWDS